MDELNEESVKKRVWYSVALCERNRVRIPIINLFYFICLELQSVYFKAMHDFSAICGHLTENVLEKS